LAKAWFILSGDLFNHLAYFVLGRLSV
jgi:hypothetical protein